MPTILVSLDDLKGGMEARTFKETADRSALTAMFDTTQNGLVEKLYSWGGLGFPRNYNILSIEITPPPVCIDGVSRGLPDYVTYLIGRSINEMVFGLESQVSGIFFGWSMPSNCIQIGVTALQ